MGFVNHTGLEQGQSHSWRQSQSSLARSPPSNGAKSPRAPPGGADLPRAGLGCCHLLQLPDFSFSWFISLPFIWETGQEASLIFFFSPPSVTADLAPAAASRGTALKQQGLFVAVPPGCLASPPQRAWRQNLGLAAKLSMLGLCDDGQQPPGWHNLAVGAEKPGTPLFALWVLQKKISKYFLLYAPVFCSQPGYGVQCWQNKAASCSCGCLGSRGAAQSFWVWVAAPKRHFSPQPLRCSERDHGRCLALWSGLSAALHSVMELLGWRRPRYYIQGRGTEIVSPPPGEKNSHFSSAYRGM